MNRQVKISSHRELIQFIENCTLSKKDISKLISQALKVVVFDEGITREDLIKEIKTCLNLYKQSGYTGIFIGLPSLDVEPNASNDAN